MRRATIMRAPTPPRRCPEKFSPPSGFPRRRNPTATPTKNSNAKSATSIRRRGRDPDRRERQDRDLLDRPHQRRGYRLVREGRRSGRDRNRFGSVGEIEAQIFSESYLLERPLLQAIRRETSPVLLVDEVDRADEEFEAFLLELLSDFQVTIPEFGTISARTIPRVVLTSNGTRELSDALRRRCLYHYLDFPDVDREAAILLMRHPGIDASLALQVARMVAMLRKEDLRKVPGVAETLDWAATLAGLDAEDLRQEPEVVHDTLIAILKTHEDRARISPETTQRLLGKVA